jgi:hypothetical protein
MTTPTKRHSVKKTAGMPDRLATAAASPLYQYKREPLTDDEANRLQNV